MSLITAPINYTIPSQPETEVISITGHTAHLADGTETEDWFLIDDGEVVL
jgi:hypothetical protein